MSAERVVKAIKRHSTFLITSHIHSEGDALGSELALASLLRKLGKTVYVVNNDSPPSNYSYLPGIKKIYSNLKNYPHQVAFIVDCPEKKRIGKVIKLIDGGRPIINIDHHMDNRKFGTINWVEPQISSTGEMVYRLFELTRTKLDKKDALNIYTAILTDTGSFRYSNTTSSTHYICGRLLKFGIDPAKIYARIYEDNSVQDVVCAAKIISQLSFAENNKIVWAKIDRYIFEKIKDRHKVLDTILDFARSINSVKVVIIFCEVGQRLVKLSLRSKSPVNVQKVASAFGGGGHKFASGCLIKAGFKKAQELVLKQVRKALN